MTLGFVGAGNMAGAIIGGIVDTKVMPGAELRVYDVDSAKTEQLSARLGVVRCASCAELIRDSQIVLMAVKPHQLGGVLEAHRDALSGKAVISIAAGWSAKMLREALNPDTRVLRVMPNTPALVGCGMTAFSRETSFTEAERAQAERVFGALGLVSWVEERQMEATTGVSGCGPAYAYLFIEAMADGGVCQGLARADATRMAAQTLMGAAKMVLESGMHPGALKDMVCSPGGATIQAVRTLEAHGFRGAVIEAVNAGADKALAMKQ